MGSNEFFGTAPRFFAIPASSRFIDITDENDIVLQLQKDDIPFVKGVAADKCPKPNIAYGNPIFELYNYKIPAKWQSNYLSPDFSPRNLFISKALLRMKLRLGRRRENSSGNVLTVR